MKNNYELLTSDSNYNIFLMLKSVIVGIAVAIVVIMYRLVLQYAEEYSHNIYSYAKNHYVFIPFLFIGLVGISLFISRLIKSNSMIKGSGIPQVKARLLGYINHNWFSTLWRKFIGGALAILAGLSVGREGPSIQLGATVAEGIGKKISKTRMERRILMASGASAGLAAAFNAPLAGVVFALEEIYKYFSPTILLSTMSAAVTADFISKQVFGLQPVFNFEVIGSISLKSYWIIILLGILLGVMGAIYNVVLLKTQKIYNNIKVLDERIKLLIPFIIAGVIGLFLPVVLGGGHSMLEEINLQNSISVLLLLFFVKWAFSMISFCSGVPGGIFFPLLVLGATLGGVVGSFAINYLGVDPSLFYNFVIIAMAGYFTAIVRAPITGVILITEMTGSFNHLLSLSVVSLIAYIVADALKSSPIYESMLDNLVGNIEGINDEEEHDKKIMIEFIIQQDSELGNQLIRDIKWPDRTLIVAIKRGDKEILPRGDLELKVGDYVWALTDLTKESETRMELELLNSFV